MPMRPEAACETGEATLKKSAHSTFPWPMTVLAVMGAAVVVFAPALILWYLLVPPPLTIKSSSLPPLPEVEKSRNAAIEYKKALEYLPRPIPSKELETAFASEDGKLSPSSVREYLKACDLSLKHLHQATSLPECQFHTKRSEAWANQADLDDLESLSYIACLRGNELEFAGRLSEAFAFYLDAFRLSQDMCHPRFPLAHPTIAIRAQSAPVGDIYRWLQADALTAKDLRKALGNLEAVERRALPNSILAECWLDTGVYTAEVNLLGSGLGANEQPGLPPGLGARTYNNVIARVRKLSLELHIAADQWDLHRLRSAQKHCLEEGFSPTPDQWLARNYLVEVYQDERLAHSAYHMFCLTADRQALLALGCLKLYRREKGRYPTSLEEAAKNAGQQRVPTDPATGKPLRYQWRKRFPLVWSAGPLTSENGENRASRPGDPKTNHPFAYTLSAAPNHWTPECR
ncbi:MAG: hypothetical protein HYU64_04000 [Armatimonadetes bacterium]|nr:hypothetical protein [Armatimonadota bacterium]